MDEDIRALYRRELAFRIFWLLFVLALVVMR